MTPGEPREIPAGTIRFLVDDHLKRLARWLRSAGIDAAWSPAIANRELYRRSWVETRTILTMDRKLWAPRLLRISSPDVKLQFREVVTTFALDPYAFAFTRCVLCNVPLESASREEVADLVPPRARERYEAYQRCPDCGKVFWRGSHTVRTLQFFMESTGLAPPAKFADLLSPSDGK